MVIVQRTHSKRVGLAALASLLTLGLCASTALADVQSADATETIASQVEQVAPDEGRYVSPSAASDGLVAIAGDVTAVAPTDGDGGVIDLASSSVTDLGVALPDDLGLGTASVASDGSLVYEGDSASIVVQVLQSGDVRLQSVTDGPDDTTSFTYSFAPHVTLVQRPDGGADITERTPQGSVVTYGSIDAPWAYGADGAAVQTYYEVSGNVLTQVIVPDAGTVFPVVADPKLTFGTRIYWALTRVEQKYFETMGAAAASAYLCTQTVGLACPAAAAAAVGIGLFLADRGGICPTSAPWLQVGFPYGYPAQKWPGPSIACRKSV